MNSTLKYYEEHATEFLESTKTAKVDKLYEPFEKCLKHPAKLLDLGCGSGRDSKYFLDKGYEVTLIDGSPSMCKAATELTGKQARCLTFDELDYDNEFDGIWACASLLHVPQAEMEATLQLVKKALKPDGILYLSFKYGETQREKEGRLFSDYTEESLRKLLDNVGDFELLELWVTEDVRLDRDEKWINLVGKKL